MSGADGVELVCFDLGRVLVRICESWHQACQCSGVPWPKGPVDAALWERLSALNYRHELGQISHEYFCDEAARAANLAAAQVQAISSNWLRGAYPGATDLVRRLVARGVRTACLSNTNDHHWKLMTVGDGPHRLPLELLTWRFASHLLGVAKPDAAIYEHVERTTRIRPGQILYFDDLLPNCQAASARGWQAVTIEVTQDPIDQMTRHLKRYRVL